MFVLAIDTSNATLSVALVENKVVLAEYTEQTRNNQSERLMPVIEQVFSEANRQVQEVDLIAVAEGPGSYTGVRIGVTVAKTLAWTLNKSLVGVSSLEVLARNVTLDGWVVPLFDARRQTVFSGVYDGTTYESLVADGHYEMASLLTRLAEGDQLVHFVGQDVDQYWEMIETALGAKARRVHENTPQASKLAQAALTMEALSSVHGFTPKYHRLPEAEVSWLQAQRDKQNG